jgi:hypothetical protein
MALAIVPSNRNSGIPCPEFDVPDDFTALVHELMSDEQVTELEASGHALALIDYLQAFAASWDADAHMAGNPDASPHIQACGVVLDLTPAPLRQPVLNE